MRLAYYDEFIKSYGFDESASIIEAAKASYNAATPILEARIQSVFNRNTRQDIFYVEEPGFSKGASVVTEFRLTQGFLASVSEIVYASRIDDLGNGISLLDTARVDLEKGVVKDLSTRYSRAFVRISYVAGFEVDKSDEELYKQDQVPDWLKELAKLRATLNLAGHPDIEQSQINIDVKGIGAETNAIIASKVRYTPNAILPL